MYKVYDGNTGRVRWVEEAPRGGQRHAEPLQHIPQPTAAFSPLMDKLMSIIPRTIGELEGEDIIMLLILYLLYKESGDEELLLIMGGYLL